jgi:Arc/MetJ-type ribon-helix-helix transcriptional regulator
MESKKRIQVNISKEAAEEIEDLRKKLNLGSISDVIRSSLKLARYVELEKEAGNEIIVRNRKSSKEKEIVFMK